MTTYELSDEQLQKLDIEDQLSCPVCTNTYYNPITLLCQHTFCYHCISDDKIKECPVCRIKKFIPVNAVSGLTDNIINKISDLYYGSQEMRKIGEDVNNYLENKRLKPEIEKNMEKNLLNCLNDLAIKTPVLPNANIGIVTSTYHLPSYNYLPAVSPYQKYYNYMKWVLLIILSGITGFIGGSVIINLVECVYGRVSIMNVGYSSIKFIGIMNILYQYICTNMF